MRSLSSTISRPTGAQLIALGVLLVVGFTAYAAITAPPITVTNTSDTAAASERGKTVVGVQGKPNGRLTMLAANGSVLWEESESHGYHDVTALPDGPVLTAVIEGGKQSCGEYSAPCFKTGFKVVNPSPEPSTEKKWLFPVRTGINSEVHDVEKLPDGRYLVADMEYERIFIVNQHGKIGWEWRASQFYEKPGDPTKQDWLHINDVDRVSEGKYLISVRNANQLLFIERGKGVTEVVNKNRDPSVMNQQHNPQYLGNGTILVADSENHRVVELKRQANGTWTPVWTLESAGGMAFTWPRDADRLPNGHTLITDSRNNRVVEVDENGSLVWSVSVPGLPYEADRVGIGESQSVPSMAELQDGQQAAKNSAETTDSKSERATHIPVVSPAFTGLTHVLPLPYWTNAWHLVVWVAGLVLVGSGVRKRRSDNRGDGGVFGVANVIRRWGGEPTRLSTSGAEPTSLIGGMVVVSDETGREFAGRIESVSVSPDMVIYDLESVNGSRRVSVAVSSSGMTMAVFDSEAGEWNDPVAVESVDVFEQV